MVSVFRADRQDAFVDSTAWYAFADRSEPVHETVGAILDRLRRERWRLFTHSLMVAETHGLITTRLGINAGLEFLDRMYHSISLTLIPLARDDEIAAVRLLHRHSDKSFSLADAVAFHAMEQRGITRVVSFDRHFRQYGRFHILDAPDSW